MHVINTSIKPESHPIHYLMHRYWGRKVHNVVSEYIKSFTSEGEVVLDPFMGSGVTIIEALKLNRKAIGVDLNPISCFIAQNTLTKIDLNLVKSGYYEIIKNIPQQALSLYQTICPKCNIMSTYDNSIWREGNLLKVKGRCSTHGIFVKNVDNFDISKIKESKIILQNLLNSNSIWIPDDEILKYVQRNGNTKLNQLFTERALVSLGVLFKEITKIGEKDINNLFKLCFSSILHNVSNMIPGDIKSGGGKAGWVISKFYTPPIHAEKNVFVNFEQRYKKILQGKLETNQLIPTNNAKILNMSSERLEGILDESIDYIFTDPPYGESIPYFAISMIWNSWLGFNVDYDNEIICDSYRKKGYDDYEARIFNTFKEMYRVLKPSRYLSFTFHNRDLRVWKAVIESCKKAGFQPINILYQPQAVSSGTQGLNRKNTLKDDFIYNFIKPKNRLPYNQQYMKSAERFIIRNIEKIIRKYKGVTHAKLYEELIPIIIQKNAYIDEKGDIIDIERLLNKNFVYKEFLVNENGRKKIEYKWYAD